jgi:DNA-binding HxlR family transcriptional regulator
MNNKIESVACISKAMEILANKWSPLIIKELLDGPKKFCEIQTLVNNINPRTLTQKLIHLEEEGIITKHQLSQNSPRKIYCLTEKGRDLQQIITQMINWGKKY